MKYVALLRGINVGGRLIKMADLRVLFDDLGFQDVETVAASGNVIFTYTRNSGAAKQTIENGLSARFGYPVKVQVYALPDLQKIVAADPFSKSDESHNYVIFFENGLEKQLVAEAHELSADSEKIRSGAGVIYWQVLKGLTLKSPLAQYLVKAKYKNYHTNRNINTLQKIINLDQR